jgi:hypothetical protein
MPAPFGAIVPFHTYMLRRFGLQSVHERLLRGDFVGNNGIPRRVRGGERANEIGLELRKGVAHQSNIMICTISPYLRAGRLFLRINFRGVQRANAVDEICTYRLTLARHALLRTVHRREDFGNQKVADCNPDSTR